MSRILVVDDDDRLRRFVCKALESAGHEILAAANGSAALKLFQEQPIDLVITDLVMPEKEGIETIVELRRLQPDLKIIAMSGGGFSAAEDYLEVARHLGAARTLTKPFALQEILDAVASLLK